MNSYEVSFYADDKIERMTIAASSEEKMWEIFDARVDNAFPDSDISVFDVIREDYYYD